MDSEDINYKEKKGPNFESMFSKKENKNVVSKLIESQFGKNEELENMEKKFEEKKRLLEICEKDRNKLQRELAKCLAENNVCDILRKKFLLNNFFFKFKI